MITILDSEIDDEPDTNDEPATNASETDVYEHVSISDWMHAPRGSNRVAGPLLDSNFQETSLTNTTSDKN